MKILYVTSLSGKRINTFMESAIIAAKQLGFDFTIASNMDLSDKEEYKKDCERYGIRAKHIDFERVPWNFKNLRAKKQLFELMKNEHYDVVHCNTPIGGVLGRICAHKTKVPCVIYQVHGFHFCKTAPKKNWLLFYPVEWLLAHWTDVLITINEEDYALAKKHMHAKCVEYVPGVGIDLQKFSPTVPDKGKNGEFRKSLGIAESGKLVLSVGELNANKNHEAVIRALARIKDKSIHYAIAGTGDLLDYLENLANELGISDRVHLLGYRSDVADLYRAADLYIQPSLREGLPVALMEAIASKTAVICSDIRGNTDLVGKNALFEPKNVNQIAEKICEYLNRDNSEDIERNYVALKKYDLEEVANDTKTIYTEQSEKIDRGGVIFLNDLYKHQQLKKSLGLPLDSTVFLSVGEINKGKNHILMIKALQQLRNDNYKYIVCGTGPLKEEHERYIRDNGLEDSVKFLGFRSDIAEILQIADYFVHLSDFEGLPVAVMEAISSRVMVICSASRGNTDLVKDKRCLFDYRSVDELIQAIHNVENMTEAERNAIIEDNYSRLLPREKSAVIERMKEIYKETEAM